MTLEERGRREQMEEAGGERGSVSSFEAGVLQLNSAQGKSRSTFIFAPSSR